MPSGEVPVNATDPTYLELGPTKTYTRRRAGWFVGPGEHSDHRTGTLRIVCQVGAHPGNRDSVNEYGVVEEFDEKLPVGLERSFLLRNDTDETQRDVYRCSVGPIGALCTCPAGDFRLPCKHASALSKLIAEKVL